MILKVSSNHDDSDSVKCFVFSYKYAIFFTISRVIMNDKNYLFLDWMSLIVLSTRGNWFAVLVVLESLLRNQD